MVYGDSRKVWMLKSEFIHGYLSAVLPGVKGSTIDINHCHTFKDVNICKDEFGLDNDWKRTQKNETISRILCVYTCDTSNETIGKEGVTEAVKFFFKIMEKCDLNPIGPMVLEHLKNHVDGLYRYFMKDKINDDPVGEKLTEDIHNHLCWGYNLIWNNWLNWCLVEYEII